jgi:hypothetical protein
MVRNKPKTFQTKSISFLQYNNLGCVTLKAKELELWKFKHFTMQKYNLKKNPLKETKTFQDIMIL